MNKHKQQSNNKVGLWTLFWTFFKTGLFTFGGGYAMISILESELVEKKKWITSQDMLDMLVIAESTPGVIAVNTATGVGFRVRKVWGAIVATLGVVLPSFIIITALSFFINAFNDNVWYKSAFAGVKACVTVLVINAFVKMFRQLEGGWFCALMVVAAFDVALFIDFNVIYLILIGAALGIVYALAEKAVAKHKSAKLPLEQSERLDRDGYAGNGDGTTNENRGDNGGGDK